MRRARLAVVLTAAAGLFAGHGVDYLLSVPDPSRRHAVLHATGHAYLPDALVAAAAAGVVGLLAALVFGFRRGRNGGGSLGWTASAIRLAAMQAVAFVALEVTERLVAGAPLGPAFVRILVLGLLLQLGVAAAGAGALVLLERAGAAAGRASAVRRLPRPVPHLVSPAARWVPAAPLLGGARLTRGPPLLAGR
jgi:hypothetical protein